MNTTNTRILYDFNSHNNLADWVIVNDGVMGGLSKSRIAISEDGHGVFSGHVSLANNGGFASLRTRFNTIDVRPHQTILIRIKGDGKRYQLRLKSSSGEAHSYISYFQTSGKWQELEFPLSEFYPSFRGRRLAMANYPKEQLTELAFLIANKKDEMFRLEIDYILLR